MYFTFRVSILLAVSAAALAAAEIRGTVLDPSDAAIPDAQVSAVNRLGVVAQTITDHSGAFLLRAAGERLTITAPGFESKTIPLDADAAQTISVHLSIAAQSDSVRVVGSAIDVPLSQQGGSVSIIPGPEIRERNEAFGLDLLRYLPGIAVNQSGPPGTVGTVFIRGGESNFGLIEIDGVPVNSFGGDVNF